MRQHLSKIYDKSERRDLFYAKHIKNFKFPSGSRGPQGPDLPFKFQFSSTSLLSPKTSLKLTIC